MKKRFFALFTVLAMALQCVAGIPSQLLPVAPVVASAAFDDAIDADEAMTIHALSIKINGVELTDGMTVHDGDLLSLDFEWSLEDDFKYVNGVFVIDLSSNLKGISLGNQVIPVGDRACYTVIDDKLYIELYEGSSNREGECRLSGELDLSKTEVEDDGSFELKFFDKDIFLIDPLQVPGLGISKDRSGSVYEQDGKYYQKFVVSIQNNSDVTAPNVFIDDVFSDSGAYVGVSDIRVNDEPALYTLTSGGFSINLGDVGPGWANRKLLSYVVELDKSMIFGDLTYDQKKNVVSAVIDGDDSTKVVREADFYVMMPSISKTGVYDNETKTITWTIVVRPELFDDADFTVTDIPDSVLSSAVSAVFGADMKISKSDMELQPDGSYVYKFSTVVPDSVLDNITETKLSNKAEVHFDDTADTPEYDKGAEGSVSIPGSLTDFVHKSAGTPADGKMPWTVVVSVPDVDVEKLVVSDYISNTISGEATKLDPTSVKVTVTGDPNVYTVVSDGSRYYIVLKDGSDVVTYVVGVFDWYVSNESMKMEFYDGEYYLNGNTYVSDWFSGCRNKDITITFDSALADEVLYCKNTATATLTIGGSSVSDSDDAEFVKDFNASKSALALNNIHYGYKDQLVHPLVWMIGVSSENYQPGDVITVTDNIPEGFEFVSDSAIVHIGSGDHYISANADYQSQLTVTESADGSQVTFSVVVNDKMIAALTTGNLYTIKIAYITNMTDEEHLAFETSTSAVTYTNTASVKVNTESPIEISSSQTLMPNPQNLVAKGVTSSGQEADKNFYAYYSVVINGEELPLNGGNNMTATDTLGSNLTLVGTPVITPNDSGEVATYSGNTITFANLKDSTRYTITYKVKVKQIFKNDVYTDEEIADMFSNSISVGVNGGTSVSSEFLIDESTYRSQGEYRHDEMKSSITISGTKSWIDEGVNKDARPATITISLEKTEYDEDDKKVGESKVTDYVVNAPVDADGNWTYTIEDLITEDYDGHTYKYNVKEVTVDGYSVSYTGSVKDITSTTLDAEHTVAITNKFTADEKETGSVVVKKVWANDTAADRPAEIIITLTDEYGAEIIKTLASTDEAVRFDDLPLYKYSRNDDGTLKREPRKYFLTESCDAAYADKMARYTSVCPEGFYLTEEDLGKDVALSAPVEKTITNTRMTIGPVVLIKTYTDTDLAALTEAKRNEILSATVFTLYSDSACTNAVGTASPVYSAGEAKVTFSADIVENTTYYLKETSVHADYEISSDVFECRIDADGKVTYKKQGTSDAYSDRFPVCENALIKTPGTITLIKTYEDTVVASLSALERNMLLSATKFTLYSDEACTTEVATAAPQYSSGVVKVVFADGLAIDTTYYLKETASPSSYKLSTDVFECRIDADGNVTYKKQGSSDEYSATFPVCENALKPTPGKISLIKTYSDADLAALTEDARNNILSATVFTLYSDAECTVAVGTASPVYTVDGATVEFSKGLSLDTVYYLKETSAHKDYEMSTDVFECKIDADGKVTYKKQGSSDAYSEAFPECENTFIKRPGSVKLIKTYENTNLHVMPSVGRDNILSATEFTLYSDAECTVVVAVASPEYKEGRAIVEFNDGLELGKTYYLKETKAHNSYIISEDVYECKVDDVGRVTYKLLGSSDEYSDAFPECVNLKQDDDDDDEGGGGGGGGGSNPFDPDHPDRPDKPDDPSEPDDPSDPDEPSDPGETEEADDPYVPDQPVRPDQPDDPIDPVDPDEPYDPEDPEETEETDEPDVPGDEETDESTEESYYPETDETSDGSDAYTDESDDGYGETSETSDRTETTDRTDIGDDTPTDTSDGDNPYTSGATVGGTVVAAAISFTAAVISRGKKRKSAK